MSEHIDAGEFVAEVRRYFSEATRIHGHGAGIEILATRARGQRVDVVFRQSPSGALIGQRYDLTKLAALFGPSATSTQLGETAASNEMAEPLGTALEVEAEGTVHANWAKGLVPDPSLVFWREIP